MFLINAIQVYVAEDHCQIFYCPHLVGETIDRSSDRHQYHDRSLSMNRTHDHQRNRRIVLFLNFHIKIQNNSAISEQRGEMITTMIFGRIKTCRHMWHMGIIAFWGINNNNDTIIREQVGRWRWRKVKPKRHTNEQGQ